MINGLGAMVWQLRNWQNGDPLFQVAQCKQFNLDWISIKIVNGTARKWEKELPNQNADLMKATVEELVKNDITVIGWGWLYGYRPEAEADATRALMEEYSQFGMTKLYQIDAESYYNKLGMRDEAMRYSARLDADTEMRQMLCTYRWPLTHQPSFPVREFMHICEATSPQVYFIGDNRPSGGALQLERSYLQYKGIKDVPFIGIAPTYLTTSGWRATKEQLVNFYNKAIGLGNPAVGIWDLPQATNVQLDAFLEIDWPNGNNTPPPDPDLKVRIEKLERDVKQLQEWQAKTDEWGNSYGG